MAETRILTSEELETVGRLIYSVTGDHRMVLCLVVSNGSVQQTTNLENPAEVVGLLSFAAAEFAAGQIDQVGAYDAGKTDA